MTIKDFIKHLRKEVKRCNNTMKDTNGEDYSYYLGLRRGLNKCITLIKLHLREQIAHERIEKL